MALGAVVLEFLVFQYYWEFMLVYDKSVYNKVSFDYVCYFGLL